jgi:hypothetical protein
MARLRCSVCRLARQDTLRVALHGLTVDWDPHPACTRVCVLPAARQADVAPRRGRHSGTAIVSPAVLSLNLPSFDHKELCRHGSELFTIEAHYPHIIQMPESWLHAVMSRLRSH